MIAILYDSNNIIKMENEFSSLKFQNVKDLYLVHRDKDLSKYDTIITDNFYDVKELYKKTILIISEELEWVYITEKLLLVQYESISIKEKMIDKFPELILVDDIVINCIPKQKLEIEPLDTQDSTIFFSGVDKPENMVDQMFDLDTKVHYEIQFYNSDTKFEPSLKHKLSWNVSTDINLKGIIQYKIIKEIENGCLPILLKENIPKYFFAYPFVITLEELNDKVLLVERVREISSFIGKMTKDEFKTLANAIYNGIYISSNWKLNFYKIAKILIES